MTALGWINTSSCRLETVPRVFLTAAASRTRALCSCTPSSQSKQVQITRQHRALRQSAVCRSTALDTAEAEADLMELELKVEGMTCDGCSSRVADALKAMSGVDKVTVNLSTGIATVEVFASDPMDAAFNKMPPMVERISQLGFKAQAHFEDW
ncbi:TPA: hypothetical protein ACH3X2_011224 [Trebouxia sp. C0005]